MKDLNRKAFEGLAQFIVVLTLLIFLPAWTINYWQAWLFLGIFSASVFTITLYLMKHDRELLARRMKAGPTAEKEKKQKTIQTFAMLSFVAIFVVSSIDHRFSWSPSFPFESIIGNILVVLGLFIVFLVFKENTFTSATIEIAQDQHVVSTGPYAQVRHPMYSGAVVMLVGIPFALGSLWGLIPVLRIIAIIIWRLRNEERFLSKNLPGYAEYRQKVQHRLVPFVW